MIGGDYATVVYSGTTADTPMSGNHIIRGEGMAVRVEGHWAEPDRIIDMTGNYWGTTEADSISAWIIDGYDEPDNHGFVDFEPFSPVPLPGEKRYMGDIKRMFR